MAIRQITDLPTVTALTGTELIHARQSTTDKSALVSQVNTYINDEFDIVPAAGSINLTDNFIMRVSAATKKVTAAILKLFVLDGFTIGNTSGEIPVSNGTKNVNLNADLLEGIHAGNATGQIPVNNGSTNVNLRAAVADNADLLDGLNSGNASGNIPVSNGTVNINLNADLLDGLNSGNSTGQIPVSNGTKNINLNADLLDGLNPGNLTGNIPISNGSNNTNLSADLLDGIHAGNGSGQIPVSNGITNANLRAAVADAAVIAVDADNADNATAGTLLHNFFDRVVYLAAAIASSPSVTLSYPAGYSVSNCVVIGCMVGDNSTFMGSLGFTSTGTVSVRLDTANLTIIGHTSFVFYKLILVRTS